MSPEKAFILSDKRAYFSRFYLKRYFALLHMHDLTFMIQQHCTTVPHKCAIA